MQQNCVLFMCMCVWFSFHLHYMLEKMEDVLSPHNSHVSSKYCELTISWSSRKHLDSSCIID
jgi:hypothetical protein